MHEFYRKIIKNICSIDILMHRIKWWTTFNCSGSQIEKIPVRCHRSENIVYVRIPEAARPPPQSSPFYYLNRISSRELCPRPSLGKFPFLAPVPHIDQGRQRRVTATHKQNASRWPDHPIYISYRPSASRITAPNKTRPPALITSGAR